MFFCGCAVDFTAQGMATPKCRFVKELSDGRLVASCAWVGLVVLRDKEIVSVIGAAEGMSNTSILSVYEREDGILMAGTDGDGIYLIRGLKKNDVVSVFSGNYFVLVSDTELQETKEILKSVTDPLISSGEKKTEYHFRIDAEELG